MLYILYYIYVDLMQSFFYSAFDTNATSSKSWTDHFQKSRLFFIGIFDIFYNAL